MRVKPQVKRLVLSPIGLNRISLVRASGESFKTVVFDIRVGKRVSCFLGEPPSAPRPAPPRPVARHAPPRPEPPVVCPGFGLDNLHRISFVRASGESFRTVVYDTLGGARVDGWLSPGKPTRRRPVLPGPATPSCAAPPRSACGIYGFWIRQL